MKSIFEYINTKTKSNIIYASNDNLREIIHEEITRLGDNADLNHIDVSKVTDFSYLFDDWKTNYNNKGIKLNPDISKWNTSKATTMSAMFRNCFKFNCDISNWDVSKVENFSAMFVGCWDFNQDLSKWDIRSAKHVDSMFVECKKLNCDLSNWDISKVESQEYMFSDCPIKSLKNKLPKGSRYK